MAHGNQAGRDEIESLFRLTLALHHLNKEMEKRFRLSLVQLFVLLRVRDMPGTSPRVLSNAVGIRPGTLTQTLRRLVRKQTIFVTVDPRDSRRKLVALTRRGKEAVDVMGQELKCLFGRLPEADHRKLTGALEYLEAFRAALNQPAPVPKKAAKPRRSPRLDLGPSAADAL